MSIGGTALQVKLTVTGSRCRCGYHRAGGPLCRELWDALSFDMRRPDGGMVAVRGEIAEPQADRTEKTLKKRKKSIYFQKKACNCPQCVL